MADSRTPFMSDGVKGAIVAALLAGAVSGGASIWSAGSWHATTEYHLTVIDGKLDAAAKASEDAKKALSDQSKEVNAAAAVAATVAKDLNEGRAVNLPRIKDLEDHSAKLDTGIAVLTEKIDGVATKVGKHDDEITESNTNIRILLDKLAPESAPPRGRGH